MKILFIQTGGTIDKDYPRIKNGYAFEIGEPAITRILSKINLNFEYQICSLLQKDSLEITTEDRQLIFKICYESDYERIIITHGTDTMIETANFLNDITNKTIVITGAMKPQRFADTDADFNLGVAIGAVHSLTTGIYIAMNGCIFSNNDCKRNQETGAFQYLNKIENV